MIVCSFGLALPVFLRITAFDGPFGIFKLLAIVLTIFLWFMASDDPFGIFKFLAIALMVFLWFMASDDPFGIFKILVIVLSVLLRFMASDYPFGIFKILVIVLSVLLKFTASDDPFATTLVSSNFSCQCWNIHLLVKCQLILIPFPNSLQFSCTNVFTIVRLKTRCCTLRRVKNTPIRSFVSRTVNRK